MLTSIETRRNAFDPAQRGYHAVYREDAVNHCPGCGRTHWHIGRILAECAFCSSAPLSESFIGSDELVHRRGTDHLGQRRLKTALPARGRAGRRAKLTHPHSFRCMICAMRMLCLLLAAALSVGLTRPSPHDGFSLVKHRSNITSLSIVGLARRRAAAWRHPVSGGAISSQFRRYGLCVRYPRDPGGRGQRNLERGQSLRSEIGNAEPKFRDRRQLGRLRLMPLLPRCFTG